MNNHARFSFDARDEALRRQRLIYWNAAQGPRVGDHVMLEDGTLHRISTKTSKHFQLSNPRFGASFHWCWWYCSYSGGHQMTLHPLASLQDTGEVSDADVWVFHHDLAGAHRSVTCTIPCRIYRLTIAT